MSWQIDPAAVEVAARAVADIAARARGLVSARLSRVTDALAGGAASRAAMAADQAWQRCSERITAALDEHARELWGTAASFVSTERAVERALEERR